MKTNTLSKITLICLILVAFSCSHEESTNEITQEATTLEKSSIDFNTNTSNKGGSNEAGPGSYKFYRISYTSGSTTSERLAITMSLKETTTYAIDFYETSDNFSQIWGFFFEDTNTVDNIINQNSLTILEHETAPSVIRVTYDTSLNEEIKDDIKSEFEIISVFNTNGQSETWAFKDCCLSGNPCDRFTDPFYIYYGLISEQVFQF